MSELSPTPTSIHETTVHRPTMKVQKKDVIDRAIDEDSYFPNKYVLGMVGASFAATIGSMMAGNRELAGQSILVTTLSCALYSSDLLHYSLSSPEIHQSSSLVNEDFNFRADRLVYSGKQPINVEGRAYSKGSNFFMVQLPALPGVDAKLPGAISLQTDLNNFALQRIRSFIEDKDHDFIVIDPGTPERTPYSPIPAENTKIGDVLSGKPAEINKPDRQLIVLTKERFQELASTVHEMFEKGIHETEDMNLINTLRLAKSAGTVEERAHAAKFLDRRLSAILERLMESHFNALPDVKMSRDPYTQAPIRQKSYLNSSVKNVKGRLMYVQINATNGEIRSNPVSKLLGTDDQTLYEVIHSKSSLRKTQIAYLIRQMIEDYGIEYLLENRPMTTDELKQKLSDFLMRSGLKLPPSKTPGEQIIKPHKSYKAKKQARAGILGAASMAALFSSVSLASNFIGGGGYGNNGEDVFGGRVEPGQLSETSSKMEFPGLPKSGVEWKIDSNMATNGYYITGTSNDFREGQWHQNEEVEEIVSYPRDVDFSSNERHMTLTRIQPITQLGETSIRIPIRENTRLVSLNLTAPNGNDMDFVTQKLTDGSIRIVVPPKLLDSAPYATIQASFVPSETSMIHAHGPTRDLKYDELSEKAQKIFRHAQTMNEEDGLMMLQDYISGSRKYSIDPPDKDKLNGIGSPESAVNAIESLSGCSCEVCNTEFVLLADSLGDERDINIAYGFLGSGDSPAGADVGSFLRTETAHAFGIDDEGTVRDATATEIASDNLTQAYIDMLRAGDNNGLTAEEMWKYKQEDLKNFADEQKNMNDIIKLAGLALAGGIGFAGLKYLYPLARRGASRKNIVALADNAVANAIPSENLEQAYNFFLWVSFAGNGSRVYSPIPLQAKTRKEALDKIRKSISYSKLTQLLEDPKEYETRAKEAGFNISGMDYSQLQFLANYLIST